MQTRSSAESGSEIARPHTALPMGARGRLEHYLFTLLTGTGAEGSLISLCLIRLLKTMAHAWRLGFIHSRHRRSSAV